MARSPPLSNPPTPRRQIGSYAPEGATGFCSNYECPAGTSDADQRASTPCVSCGGPGLYSPAGSTRTCVELRCRSGETDHDSDPTTPCALCAPGTYAGTGHSGNCTLCPAGFTDEVEYSWLGLDCIDGGEPVGHLSRVALLHPAGTRPVPCSASCPCSSGAD